MEFTNVISIVVESLAIVVSSLIAIFLATQKKRDRIDGLVLKMVVLSIVLLASDILTYAYLDGVGKGAWLIVRVSNFMVFFLNYMLFMGCGFILREVIRPQDKFQKNLFTCVFAMAWAEIALLIVSQFGGFLYYFDANNIYHRGSWFVLSQIAPIIGGTIYFVEVIMNKRRMPLNEFVIFIVYLLIPFFAIFFQIFVYGFPVQTVASAFGVFALYVNRIFVIDWLILCRAFLKRAMSLPLPIWEFGRSLFLMAKSLA